MHRDGLKKRMSESIPTPRNTSPQGDDAHADRQTFVWVALFMVFAFIVDILSDITDIGRDQLDLTVQKLIIYEATGYFFILILFPVVAWFTSRATPGQHNWRNVISAHLAGAIVVSVAHVSLMVVTRKLVFLVAYPYPYIFSDNLLQSMVYEFRKDLLTYCLFLFFITFGRQLAQQQRELAAAREDAKTTKRLTLKCGGRAIWIDASQVYWIKSASNYVEVAANGKVHLARATLGAIENQLSDAGAKAVRVHRSYVVNADHIQEITPTGEGDVKIKMNDGAIIPGSRRYRDRLNGPS